MLPQTSQILRSRQTNTAMAETEKKLAREYLKEETKKLKDYDQAVVWRLMGTPLGLRRCRRGLSFLALVV